MDDSSVHTDCKGAVVRRAARVLLFDPLNRVLLIECHSPDDRERRFWIAPGGGVEAGEGLADAAQRELWEETGIAEAVLGPVVWLRRHVFEWDGRTLDQREEFLIARTPALRVRPTGLGRDELNYLLRFRWWTLPELLDPPPETTFAPRRLGPLLRDLLESGAPRSPFDVGI
jgi:8-oxo-dGTP pyrophosphatase MutT (NUDIX family)